MLTVSNYRTPKVSVGIPTYSRPGGLRSVLESVCGQSYRNIEILVSNDSSPLEETRVIINEFESKDHRIRSFHQPTNLGVLRNATFLLERATGEYFVWVSDDDWRDRDFIGALLHEVKATGFRCAFCDYNETLEDGTASTRHPSSHTKIFRPFKRRGNIERIIAYYLQESSLGKQNLFYSLFDRQVLLDVDFAKASDGYTDLAMDSMIVFQIIQNEPFGQVSTRLCTLTTGNQKQYPTRGARNAVLYGGSRSVHRGGGGFLLREAIDLRRYLRNSGQRQVRLLILALFPLRLVYGFWCALAAKILGRNRFVQLFVDRNRRSILRS